MFMSIDSVPKTTYTLRICNNKEFWFGHLSVQLEHQELQVSDSHFFKNDFYSNKEVFLWPSSFTKKDRW